jgi:hypothetical protein
MAWAMMAALRHGLGDRSTSSLLFSRIERIKVFAKKVNRRGPGKFRVTKCHNGHNLVENNSIVK